MAKSHDPPPHTHCNTSSSSSSSAPPPPPPSIPSSKHSKNSRRRGVNKGTRNDKEGRQQEQQEAEDEEGRKNVDASSRSSFKSSSVASSSSSSSSPSPSPSSPSSSRFTNGFHPAERPIKEEEEEGKEKEEGKEARTARTEASSSRTRGLYLEERFSFCKNCVISLYNDQKPHVDAFIERIMEWKTRGQSLMERTWPPLQRILITIGSIALTLFLAWLNCFIQGFKSLVQLGSAAIFMIICCSVMNLGFLGGFVKLLIALGFSGAAAFFLGYMYALWIFGIFGGAILLLYGSVWLTGGILLIAVVLFTMDQPRLSVLVGLLYSTYSAISIGGGFAFTICLNLAFIFSNFMIYFLHTNARNNSTQDAFSQENKTKHKKEKGSKHADSKGAFKAEVSGISGSASTSEVEASMGDGEVERVLNCKDHYAVLELSRFAEVDLSALKRDYRKKAMLLHPDKNLGNTFAEEAFKRLQNAYEILLDPSKKLGYDEELKREEMVLAFKHFQQELFQAGRPGTSSNWHPNSEDEIDDSVQRIMCKKCNRTHRWVCTDRSKLRARWCQECQDHHQAKDGDGWVEQQAQAFFFGVFQKVDAPQAFACAESKIYEVTEWVQCQGMKCIPNSHKPSFHVSTTGMFRSSSKGARANKTAADNFPFVQMNEKMTEEEFMRWLENAMASGMFGDTTNASEQPDQKVGSCTKPSRKKRKGKNKW